MICEHDLSVVAVAVRRTPRAHGAGNGGLGSWVKQLRLGKIPARPRQERLITVSGEGGTATPAGRSQSHRRAGSLLGQRTDPSGHAAQVPHSGGFLVQVLSFRGKTSLACWLAVAAALRPPGCARSPLRAREYSTAHTQMPRPHEGAFGVRSLRLLRGALQTEVSQFT